MQTMSTRFTHCCQLPVVGTLQGWQAQGLYIWSVAPLRTAILPPKTVGCLERNENKDCIPWAWATSPTHRRGARRCFPTPGAPNERRHRGCP